MKLFGYLYDKTLELSRHKHAQWWLGGVSAAESSFFPIPVDIMLAPMVMSEREKAWRFALIATLFSVLGGIIGWVLGFSFIDAVMPFIDKMGWLHHYQTAENLFAEWGGWVVFIAGFSPIPYKVFTIAAGAVHMNLLLFVLASVVGRAGRFFLVAALVKWGGPSFEKHFLKYIDWLGWGTVLVGVIVWLIMR